MKFIDKVTGNTLESENTMVVEQYVKYPERYEMVEEKKPAKEQTK